MFSPATVDSLEVHSNAPSHVSMTARHERADALPFVLVPADGAASGCARACPRGRGRRRRPGRGCADAACAVEIVHELSLVHDDIEVGDVRVTSATACGRASASRTASTPAMRCARSRTRTARRDVDASAEVTVAMTRTLHEAHLALCGGHARDIAFQNRPRISPADYRAMIEGKTGALFGAACELGAWSAGADVERAGAYARLGRAYAAHPSRRRRARHLGEGGAPCSARAGRQRWSFRSCGPRRGRRRRRATRLSRRTPRRRRARRGWALVAALDALGARDASLRELGAELEHADDVARAFAIDRSERVRSLFAQALRRVA